MVTTRKKLAKVFNGTYTYDVDAQVKKWNDLT